jgi:hypothetical protein
MKKVTPTEKQGPINSIKDTVTGKWDIAFPGDVFELPDSQAAKLIKAGKVEPVKE